MLKIKINSKQYLSKTILKDVNIHILENGIYGFFGKNGQGKTTLFHCILGFTKYQGEVLFNNNKLESPEIAWIPTEPDMYEYLTCHEFIMFYKNISRGKNNTLDPDKLLFDIELNKIIKECSTGTKKKVYLNSILQISDYKIYIFDEPFNGLDIESNYSLLKYIQELGKTNIVLISSHIIEIILPYLKECYFINQTTVIKHTKENLLKNFELNV